MPSWHVQEPYHSDNKHLHIPDNNNGPPQLPDMAVETYIYLRHIMDTLTDSQPIVEQFYIQSTVTQC
jgi:hypothetical protein